MENKFIARWEAKQSKLLNFITFPPKQAQVNQK